jgi:hypothetical protein
LLLAVSVAIANVGTPLCAEPPTLTPVAQSAVDTVRQVSVLIYLVDLVDIDGAEQTFYADVIVAARWQDPALANPDAGVRTYSRGEVWSPNLLIVNQRGASSSLPDVVRADAAGNVQYTMRLTGDFSARMDLRDFPRDRQRFNIWVVAPPLGGETVELVPDSSAGLLRNDALSISDWNLSEPELESRPYRATPNAVAISGVSLAFEADRKLAYYIIQVLIPLTAVVMMAWAVFWIDPAVVPTRVGVVVTTMLTLIAYRFMLGGLVPRLPYLTRLDYFMLWSTSLVVLTLFAMAGASFLKTRGRDDLVRVIDRTGRVTYPVVLAAVTLLLWVL